MLFKLFSRGPLVIVLFRGARTLTACFTARRLTGWIIARVCVWEGFAPLIKATNNSI